MSSSNISVVTIAGLPETQDLSGDPIQAEIDQSIKLQSQYLAVIEGEEFLQDEVVNSESGVCTQKEDFIHDARCELAIAKLNEMDLRVKQVGRRIREDRRAGVTSPDEVFVDMQKYTDQKFAWSVISDWVDYGKVKTEEILASEWRIYKADEYILIGTDIHFLESVSVLCNSVIRAARKFEQYDGPEFFGDRPAFLVTDGVIAGVQGFTASEGLGVLVNNKEVPYQTFGKTFVHEADHVFSGVSALEFLSEGKSMMMQSLAFPDRVDFLELEIPDLKWVIEKIRKENLTLDPRDIVDNMLSDRDGMTKEAIRTSMMYYLSSYYIRGILDYMADEGVSTEEAMEAFLFLFSLSKKEEMSSAYEEELVGEVSVPKKLIKDYKCVVPDREVYAELLCRIGVRDFDKYLGCVVRAINEDPSHPFNEEQVKSLRKMFEFTDES